MALMMRSATGLKAATVRRAAPVSRARVVAVRASAAQNKPFELDPLVLGAGFLGWTLPSTIGVPAFGGNSLFGLFTKSIGDELSHWPVGPALTDPFWLYLITWHVGLFVVLLLGKVGVEGRKQGYWN